MSAMVFGKSSLSMMPCAHCGLDTLHKYGVCLACGDGVSSLLPRLSDIAIGGRDYARAVRGGKRSRKYARRDAIEAAPKKQ